ncbi:hypothetical protein COCNU_01G014640 [Cocos nucifera]|uniref:Uncharacterized protein n=1 Tax=Cocos nucifera TaxID=13894 RepID=A0A8K0HWJ3_COCNU|nr:hypothetical protein COCNU_01G014640 [Cocos nucifera]
MVRWGSVKKWGTKRVARDRGMVALVEGRRQQRYHRLRKGAGVVWGEREHKRKEKGGGEPTMGGGEEPVAVWGEEEHKRKKRVDGSVMDGGEETAVVWGEGDEWENG